MLILLNFFSLLFIKNFFIKKIYKIQYISTDDSIIVTLNDRNTVGESISDIDIAYSLWAPSHGIDAPDQTIGSNIMENNDLFSKTKLNLVFSIDNIGQSKKKKNTPSLFNIKYFHNSIKHKTI